MDKKNNIYNKIQNIDEEFKLSDYTIEELEIIFNTKKNSKEVFKKNYFAFYDDIKSSSLKKQDW